LFFPLLVVVFRQTAAGVIAAMSDEEAGVAAWAPSSAPVRYCGYLIKAPPLQKSTNSSVKVDRLCAAVPPA
jgi:hypothetical protein